MLPRVIPGITSSCLPTSKRTIRPGISSSSPTISAAITAWRPGLGWQIIHASSTSSSPLEPVGSISRKAGGDSSAAMPSPGRALPIPTRSSKRHAWPPLNSIGGPNPGSGDGLPRRGAAIAVSFVTGFKERSTSTTTAVGYYFYRPRPVSAPGLRHGGETGLPYGEGNGAA